jgi:hypothetical protein
MKYLCGESEKLKAGERNVQRNNLIKAACIGWRRK